MSAIKYDLEQNDWAEDINGNSVYILDAESGAKGYYCPGCNNEMQAVRTKIEGRKSYFRHHVTDIVIERECTFSNETYRHKISKEVLQRLKHIKLPKVIIGPFDRKSELPHYILDNEKFILAKTVRNEVSFYEDEDGNISWSQQQQHNKDLLVRADSAFFDLDDQPILLIEFNATHKVDPEKLAKLRYLGIDAIEVKVPKGDKEQIEQNLKVSKNIRWLFNNLEAKTEYELFHSTTEQIVPSTDLNQGRIPEETFSCRSAELGNLIRSINKTLQSKSYTDEEERIGRDLQRVKRNAAETEREWIQLQEAIDKLFKEPGKHLSDRESALRNEQRDLEERYNTKKSEITEEERRIEQEIYEREWVERRAKDDFEGIKERLAIDIEYEGIEIDRIEREKRNLSEGISKKIDQDKEGIESQVNAIEARILEVKREQELIREIDKKSEFDFEETRRRIESNVVERKNQAGRDHRDLQRRVTESVQKGYRIGEFSMSKRMAGLFEAGRILGTFEERRDALERIRRAWDSLRSGAYKNWYKKR